MQKILYSFLIIAMMSLTLNAKQISQNEALDIATKFNSSVTTHTQSIAGSRDVLKLAYKASAKEDVVPYYVFDKADNGGYIIVSGDDEADAILGYTDSGSFDYDSCPENMKWWLSTYASQIGALLKGDIKASANIAPKAGKSVAPLLKDIKWNQSDPYNRLAPTLTNGNKTVTGCVATAMAQIMYFHQWPVKGTGSLTYTTKSYKFNLTADFGATTYAWDKMTPTYNSSSSEESCEAVATLMYHCGVASYMDYGPSSGANTGVAICGMRDYFNYDKGMRLLSREYYSRSVWEGIMISEIDANRPVMYGGQSKTGGHQFVLDGYDSNKMFHINWGWGGMSNGYFKIEALTPGAQGIGGSTSGYNYNQDAVIGIQKPTNESVKHEYSMVVDAVSVTPGDYEKGAKINVSLSNFTNAGYGSISGQASIAIVNAESGTVVANDVFRSSFSLGAGYYYKSISAEVMVPVNIADGQYQIIPMVNVSGTTDWELCDIAILGKKSYITVSGNKVTASSDMPQSNISAVITEINPIAAGNILTGASATFVADITNIGDEYYGKVYAAILDKNTLAKISEGSEVVVDIQKGETQTVKFIDAINVAAGDYKLVILDEAGNHISATKDITVQPTPEKENLFLDGFTFVDNNNVPKDNMEATVKIRNTGGFYIGTARIIIFSMTTLRGVADIFADFAVDANSTATVTIKGATDIDMGKYFARVYYKDNTALANGTIRNRLEFTLTGESGIEDVTVSDIVKIYPNPASDYIMISCESESVRNVQIYDLTGRIVMEDEFTSRIDVSSLSAGNYLLKIKTDEGEFVKQFIKK